jgi:hypothetical protein
MVVGEAVVERKAAMSQSSIRMLLPRRGLGLVDYLQKKWNGAPIQYLGIALWTQNWVPKARGTVNNSY